ncbi:MAG TPA: hypothetical protein VGL75_08620 [Acidothermaceae bacterium]|jgi:hypothetical protein
MAVLHRLLAALRRQLKAVDSVLAMPLLKRPIARYRAGQARRLAAKVARAADPATSRRRLLAMTVFSARRTPIARALAGNRSTPRLCLRVFAHGPWDVAAAVAGNASTPLRVLASSFIHREAWAVRNALACNPSTPVAALQRLATSYEAVIRMRVAANVALPSPTVNALLQDRDVYVRAVAAGNPRASADALEQLVRPMRDPAWVLRVAASNPSCPRELADQTLTWIALGGTGNTDPSFDPLTCNGHPGDTTVSVWSWYRQAAIEGGEGSEMHPLWRVRSAITSSWPRIPGRVLMTLAVDPQPEVRQSVSRFKELTFARLKHLARDVDPQVAAGAVRAIKQKRKSKTFWRRYLMRRGFVLPLLLVGLWLPPLLSSHNDPSQIQPPSLSQGTIYWQPGDPFNAYWYTNADGVPDVLPGGGSVFADPVDTAGNSVVVLSTGSIPFSVELGDPALTPFGSPIAAEFQLGTDSSTTMVVRPGESPINFFVTTNVAGEVTNADLRITY